MPSVNAAPVAIDDSGADLESLVMGVLLERLENLLAADGVATVLLALDPSDVAAAVAAAIILSANDTLGEIPSASTLDSVETLPTKLVL